MKAEKNYHLESDYEEKPLSHASSSNTKATSSASSDFQNCPICLCSFESDTLVSLDVCAHKFCFECIQEWSKVRSITNKNFYKFFLNILFNYLTTSVEDQYVSDRSTHVQLLGSATAEQDRETNQGRRSHEYRRDGRRCGQRFYFL